MHTRLTIIIIHIDYLWLKETITNSKYTNNSKTLLYTQDFVARAHDKRFAQNTSKFRFRFVVVVDVMQYIIVMNRRLNNKRKSMQCYKMLKIIDNDYY